MNAVGIDVSKGRSTVTICRLGDVVILAPRYYRHTQSSINELITTIKGLEGETKVCMEHTGRYYEPVASWLSSAGIFVSAVNPALIKEFGNESIRAPRACSHKAKRMSFRQILPSAALKIFDVRQYACKFLPCIRRKFARRSTHLSYVNRP